MKHHPSDLRNCFIFSHSRVPHWANDIVAPVLHCNFFLLQKIPWPISCTFTTTKFKGGVDWRHTWPLEHSTSTTLPTTTEVVRERVAIATLPHLNSPCNPHIKPSEKFTQRYLQIFLQFGAIHNPTAICILKHPKNFNNFLNAHLVSPHKKTPELSYEEI